MPLTILVTLGPTREFIDPVRFISNASSGKMGHAIVECALKKNFNVIAVNGQCNQVAASKKCKVISVVSAKEMLDAVKKNLKSADIFIGAAAVSDYRPVSVLKNKIKKNSDFLNLKLVKNPDIIKYVSEHKKNQVVVGFALETNNLLSYAKKKLKEKKLDMIVANGIKTVGSDKSDPSFIFKSGKIKKINFSEKKLIAKEIINESVRIFKNYQSCKVGA